MKELDLLKKHWNDQNSFPKISALEITKMIQKRSTSVVMWIFLISCIEFILLNALSYFYSFDERYTEISSQTVRFLLFNMSYISAGISVIFIALFYYSYRKISVCSSTKQLMQQILKTKATINTYIYLNLIFIAIGFLLSAADVLYNNAIQSTKINAIRISVTVLILLLFIALVWLYYKIIYGLLIKKLMKNYRELEKIDIE